MSGLRDKTERYSSADFLQLVSGSGKGSARVTTKGAPSRSAAADQPGPAKASGKKKHSPEERKRLDKAKEIAEAIKEERRKLLAAHLNTEVVAEYKFHEGRGWLHDFYLPSHKVAIEIEGGIWQQGRHTRGKGYLSDMHKYNAAQLQGIRVFRFTPDMLLDPESLYFLTKAITNTHENF